MGFITDSQAEAKDLESIESEALQTKTEVNDSAVANDVLRAEFTALDDILSAESQSTSIVDKYLDSGRKQQKEVTSGEFYFAMVVSNMQFFPPP